MGFLRNLFDALFGGSKVEGEVVADEPAAALPDTEAHSQISILEDGEIIEQITPMQPLQPVPQTRQLPPIEEVIREVSRLSYGQATDVGKERANNQDSLLVMTSVLSSMANFEPFNLFVVADGMGGHGGGDIASAITTATLAQKMMGEAYLPTLGQTQPDTEAMPDVRAILVEAFRLAGERIEAAGVEGGTTCTAVVLQGSVMHLAHVGDSRAYLIRQGEIEKLTRDHSLTGRLVEIGQLSPEEVRTHPERSKLYKTLGMGSDQEPEVVTRHIEADSWLFLCSDGLWEPVDEETMLAILSINPNPQQACEKLVGLANDLGGDDNITAVLVHIPA